jgi:class 3 adenylate cyclase/tetratricopeptide (TPR) repeat protein
MRCSVCSFDNRAGARFCGECGQSLGSAVECAHCATQNPAGQKHCNGCGRPLARAAERGARDPRSYTPAHLTERILTSRSALEGERKQVTVLFADVQGSMDLAESIDAEEWHRILDGFFAILADGIHRFEGTINQFTGDGVMALFGAPIAHEDHALRACHAALALCEGLARYSAELRRTRGLSFSVRMGLNSGEVVVGRIGDDLRMDYTAQGRTVGLAARVQQIAAPDRVYVTESVARLVDGYFRLVELGEFAIKGVRGPVRVFELAGVGAMRTRLDVSRSRGFSRFVGREEESRVLDEALDAALAGRGNVVALVAQAGVGKSRLTHEFLARCRKRGIAAFEAHGVAHGKSVPLLSVLELVRAYFGITERDGGAEARRKIAGTLVLLDDTLRGELPLVFEFMGIGDPQRPAPRADTESRQRQMRALMARILAARSQAEPAVLVVEDLHWVDGASEGFVIDLAEAVRGTRTLLLVNFRPDYDGAWLGAPDRRVIALAPLGADAATELLRDLLGTDPSLRAVAERIEFHAGGNPFFLEEVVLSLAETGVLEGRRGAYRLVRDPQALGVPPTVQAVLAARIDRLGEREKDVLQTSAVLGKEFPLHLLAKVSSIPQATVEARLQPLVAGEFLYEQSFLPETIYAFKHPLTQEVAYQSQLSERRSVVHAAVARALAEGDAERNDGLAGLVAHHRERAGEILEAARWTRRAAEWAETRNLGEALVHWRKLRDLLANVAESPESMSLALAARANIIGLGVWHGDPENQSATLFAEGRDLAIRLGNTRALALLESAYSGALSSLGDVDAAIEHSLEGLRLAEHCGDDSVKLAIRVPLVYAYEIAGRIEDAVELTQEVLRHPPEDPKLGAGALGFSPYAFFAYFAANLLTQLGRLDEARVQLERALELARELDEPDIQSLAHGFFCYFARCSGDPETARSHAADAVRIAEALGSALSRTFAYRGLGISHLMSEEWQPAASALENALKIARESRTVLWVEPYVLADLAEAYVALGRVAEGLQTIERALELVRRSRSRNGVCHVRLAQARILLQTESAATSADVVAALEEARQAGEPSYAPQIHLARAKLAALEGDTALRKQELQRAASTAEAIGALGYGRIAALELDASQVGRDKMPA